MNRNGVSNSSGSVRRTRFSCWTLRVEARETSFISSCPTRAAVVSVVLLYLTRPMKKVAVGSRVGVRCVSGREQEGAQRRAARQGPQPQACWWLVFHLESPSFAQDPFGAQAWPAPAARTQALSPAGRRSGFGAPRLFDLGLDARCHEVSRVAAFLGSFRARPSLSDAHCRRVSMLRAVSRNSRLISRISTVRRGDGCFVGVLDVDGVEAGYFGAELQCRRAARGAIPAIWSRHRLLLVLDPER